MTSNIQSAVAVLEQARTITPMERRVLQALRDRGPGLLLELAMRVLSLPEQVAPLLRSLQERGLVRPERFGGSALGDELWTITPLGLQTLEAAQALAQQSATPPSQPSPQGPAQRSASPPPAGSADDVPSLLQQEAILLRKLGKLAEKRGDTEEAAQYYRQALELLRQMRRDQA